MNETMEPCSIEIFGIFGIFWLGFGGGGGVWLCLAMGVRQPPNLAVEPLAWTWAIGQEDPAVIDNVNCIKKQ